MRANDDMAPENELLALCRKRIESKLGWEDSAQWTNQDFEMISAKIQEETGVSLSVATLKRIWGKVKYDSSPTVTTLNALAQFAGYENWRAFRQQQQQHQSKSAKAPEQSPSNKLHNRNHFKYWGRTMAASVLGLAAVIHLIFAVRKEPSPSAEDFKFSSKKVVSKGVPNTVIFDYDASSAPTDCVFIQQSWDPRLRSRVSPQGAQHTSIYYQPGYFQAKLVIGDRVVREHDLWITTDGWLALLRRDPVPVYFDSSEFRQEGVLHVPLQHIQSHGIALQPEAPWVSFHNVRDFGEVTVDDFVFRTSVKSDYGGGSAVCQNMHIVLLAQGGAIVVPLSIPGCASDLRLILNQEALEGKTTDLSRLTASLGDWTEVTLESAHGELRITVGHNDSLTVPLRGKNKIVGLVYRFQGTGSVDWVELGSRAQVLFRDDFEH